jgi:hypothetical protein
MWKMKKLTLCSPKGEVLKRDLAVKIQEGVFVIVITVRHEDGTAYDWRDVAR